MKVGSIGQEISDQLVLTEREYVDPLGRGRDIWYHHIDEQTAESAMRHLKGRYELRKYRKWQAAE